MCLRLFVHLSVLNEARSWDDVLINNFNDVTPVRRVNCQLVCLKDIDDCVDLGNELNKLSRNMEKIGSEVRTYVEFINKAIYPNKANCIFINATIHKDQLQT